jgi:hypothetical protein
MSELLGIYLNDHLAGAVAGHELAKRTLGQNRGTPYEQDLEMLAREIGEDKQTLEGLMDDLGIRKVAWKTSAAWVAEKVGRAKLNGALIGYSPLSRLEELEGLRSGVEGKASMWNNLAGAASARRRIDPAEMRRLLQRATDQSDRLKRLAGRAAKEALGGT